MEFWLSSEKPAPERKRKQITSALEKHEEYLKMRAAILSGRMRPMQSAIITVGPDDAKRLGHKWPWRSITDGLRRLIKSMNLESEFTVRKFETANSGIWAVQVTYEPPMVKTQPHEVQPAQERRRPGRPRKTA
jgi:hypothetical protein